MTSARNRIGRYVEVFFVLGMLLLVTAPRTFAQARIWATYGTADTGPNGPIGLPNGVSMPVHLWMGGGSNPSSVPPCRSGAAGDEICGVAFRLVASGSFEIIDFLGNPNFDSGPSPLPFRVTALPNDRMGANNFDLGVPGTANRYLGRLTVTGTAVTPLSNVSVSGKAVGANLEMRDLVVENVLVPEPTLLGTLAAGGSLLALFSRRRSLRP